jgi:uncharacterized membrane protein YdfJ with MMPL/SSD domain
MVDAVVVRAVVLPSIMTLLGRVNWWPTQPFAETPVFGTTPRSERKN